jgi:predicted negative regulator of RcsB-dependent stress response
LTKNYEWQVHINEGFAFNVKAPDAETAIMQAFAKYWKENPKPIILMFDIQVLNLTQYKVYDEARKARQEKTKPYCI